MEDTVLQEVYGKDPQENPFPHRDMMRGHLLQHKC